MEPGPVRGSALEIRIPKPTDIPAVAALHHASWVATYGPLLATDQARLLRADERTAYWDRLVRMRPPELGSLVAARAGSIVGLVQWETGIGGDPAIGEIHALHVAGAEQGQGVGRALLEAAMAALRDLGMRRAVLWVLQDNLTARAFYERLGWQWDGTRVERPLGAFAGFPRVVEVRYILDL